MNYTQFYKKRLISEDEKDGIKQRLYVLHGG
ncbi:hypothetical protein SAMN05443253_106142 [Bacillus sp. OK048]|nr:hypothetical protein SAMN05443253_106142 [Bacillus sp. OK048]